MRNEQLAVSNAGRRVCKSPFSDRRHGVKAAFGMPARSAFKPAGGLPQKMRPNFKNLRILKEKGKRKK
jgi:hypothetical protein